MEKHPVFEVVFADWQSSVDKLLFASDFAGIFSESGKRQILLKPNLVSIAPPPVTTPVDLIEAIVTVLRQILPDVEVIIGEGTGIKEYETDLPFSNLGYTAMAEKLDVKLIDLNFSPLVKLNNPDCLRWPEMYIPEIVMDSFLLSVPVLKAHSLSEVTLTMKNMIGVAPPEFYDAGGWKKSAFHQDIQNAIFDLNRYRTPDFSIIDATEGMSEAHLWGPSCDPAPNKLAVSVDPVAIDAWGCGVLQRNWKNIDHVSKADGVLGYAETELISLSGVL